METNRQVVGSGLLLIFISSIVKLFSGMPVIGAIAGIAGIAIALYGLYKMAGQHEGYKNAFIIGVVSIAVSILQLIFGRITLFSVILGLIATILGFLSVYFICVATSAMLDGISTELMVRAELIWKLYLICTIIVLVCSVLGVIPIIRILAAVLLVIAGIVQLVALILYMIFIYKSYKILSA